jgi:hypothetical protein
MPTFEELRHKTVAELRTMAKEMEHEALKGYTAMRKDILLRALCTALGIEAGEHREALGLDRRGIKGRIRELKARRDAALQARDPKELKRIRRKIHRLKHRMRAAAG